jgi:hypothetical protein
MPSTFLAESADFHLGLNAPECEPSPSARSIPIAKPSCETTGQMSLFSETCENLPPKLWPTPDGVNRKSARALTASINNGRRSGGGQSSPPGLEQAVELAMGVLPRELANVDQLPPATRALISSAAASPVRTSQSQEKARALKALARDYGASTPELLAKYDHATSSWKTSQLCLDGELSVFSETWPRSGLTRNGTAYQLPPLVPLTDATGSGLWPTVTAGDAKASGSRNTSQSNAHPGVSLTDFVRQDGGTGRMWPTPRAQDFKSGAGYSHAGKSQTPQLRHLLGGSLNPTWVEWLMGFPLGFTDLGR